MKGIKEEKKGGWRLLMSQHVFLSALRTVPLLVGYDHIPIIIKNTYI